VKRWLFRFLAENWLVLLVVLALASVVVLLVAMAKGVARGTEEALASLGVNIGESQIGELLTAPLDAPWWAWIPPLGIVYWLGWWTSPSEEDES
jgi:hypothetical protein